VDLANGIHPLVCDAELKNEEEREEKREDSSGHVNNLRGCAVDSRGVYLNFCEKPMGKKGDGSNGMME